MAIVAVGTEVVIDTSKLPCFQKVTATEGLEKMENICPVSWHPRRQSEINSPNLKPQADMRATLSSYL